MHRDAFRRVVVHELGGDYGAGRLAVLDPRDRSGDQVVVRIQHRWIGLTGIEIARAAESVGSGSACTVAHARSQIKAGEFVGSIRLSLHHAVIVVDSVARLDQRIGPAAIEDELASVSRELAQIRVCIIDVGRELLVCGALVKKLNHAAGIAGAWRAASKSEQSPAPMRQVL